ncbi:hypothetical protein GCM10009670_07350 [Citricoccus alkalitolerans]
MASTVLDTETDVADVAGTGPGPGVGTGVGIDAGMGVDAGVEGEAMGPPFHQRTPCGEGQAPRARRTRGSVPIDRTPSH